MIVLTIPSQPVGLRPSWGPSLRRKRRLRALLFRLFTYSNQGTPVPASRADLPRLEAECALDAGIGISGKALSRLLTELVGGRNDGSYFVSADLSWDSYRQLRERLSQQGAVRVRRSESSDRAYLGGASKEILDLHISDPPLGEPCPHYLIGWFPEACEVTLQLLDLQASWEGRDGPLFPDNGPTSCRHSFEITTVFQQEDPLVLSLFLPRMYRTSTLVRAATRAFGTSLAVVQVPGSKVGRWLRDDTLDLEEITEQLRYQ